tara:strand:+ start:949 stop:1683 length:735 start_codon:yes stop_codon:yes gene_type:complete
MLIIRNLLFNLLFFFGSLFLSLILIWTILLPQKWTIKIIRNVYFRSVMYLEKYVLGLDYELVGLENLPDEPFILAAKHQSAYETLKLPYLFEDVAIVLKRELTWIPLWGMYPPAMGMIPIDRGSAKVAMKSILKGAERILNEEHRPLLIFPQGTRTAVGEQRKYKIGIARIYEKVNRPVVPVALNSGLYWGKNKFWKRSGCVTLKFLPPIQPGLDQKAFMERLETAIETESQMLLAKPELTEDA